MADKPIPGFPKYFAREDGEIVSLHRKKPRVLKRRPHRSGYVMVTLCDGEGEQVTSVAHRFIAAAFHPNPDGLPCVRHLDGDKQNNAPANLAWGTHEENEADKVNHGRRRYGTARMKLGRAARAKAERMFVRGVARKEIADHFGVDRSTISRLIAGKTWRNRKWPIAAKAAAR